MYESIGLDLIFSLEISMRKAGARGGAELRWALSYGENSKTGSVKVPVKLFGRSAAVNVTFTPKKYFYGAPKNGARGA